MSFTLRSLASFAGLLVLANGHAVMNTPKPFGYGSALQNGPMAESAFPCKKGEVQFTGDATTWDSGTPQPLKLLSGATHGGG